MWLGGGLLCFLVLFLTIHLAIAGNSSSGEGEVNPFSSQSLQKMATLLDVARPRKAFDSFLDLIEKSAFHPIRTNAWMLSRPINPQAAHVVLAAALDTRHLARDAVAFTGTLRGTGYQGDIVVFVLPNSDGLFLDKLTEYNVSIYVVESYCGGAPGNPLCSYQEDRIRLPPTVLRIFLYMNILRRYDSKRLTVLLSDFRDVLFQTNPFTFPPVKILHQHAASSRRNHIFFTTEAYPNRIFGRCPLSSLVMVSCYGMELYTEMANQLISTSLNSVATKDSALVYLHLLLTQLDPRMRNLFGNSSVDRLPSEPYLSISSGGKGADDPKDCVRFGVDIAFHNTLLFKHVFHRFLDVRIFPQGEGPINVVGGFFGPNKLLKAQLKDWRILRGDPPFQYIYNWNGRISPVVHQLDRFLLTELDGDYRAHLAAFQQIVS